MYGLVRSLPSIFYRTSFPFFPSIFLECIFPFFWNQGLEFDCVFICSVEEGILPSFNSGQQIKMEGNERTAYCTSVLTRFGKEKYLLYLFIYLFIYFYYLDPIANTTMRLNDYCGVEEEKRLLYVGKYD